MEGVTKVQVTEERVGQVSTCILTCSSPSPLTSARLVICLQKEPDSPRGEVAHEPIEDSTMLHETATPLLPNTTTVSSQDVVLISNTPVSLEDLPEDPSIDLQQWTKARKDLRSATGLAMFIDSLRSQPDLHAHTDFELPPYLRQYADRRPTQKVSSRKHTPSTVPHRSCSAC